MSGVFALFLAFHIFGLIFPMIYHGIEYSFASKEFSKQEYRKSSKLRGYSGYSKEDHIIAQKKMRHHLIHFFASPFCWELIVSYYLTIALINEFKTLSRALTKKIE